MSYEIHEERQENILVRFILGVGRLIRSFFVVIGVFTTLLVGMAVWGIVSLSRHQAVQTPVAIDEDSILTLDLSGRLTDRAPVFSDVLFGQLFGDDEGILYTEEVRQAIERAATQQHVKGIHMVIGDLQGSLAEIEELRGALIRFRESKKPVQAHLTAADNGTFLLATAADTIALAPSGNLMIPGPFFQLVYFGDALRKLGVEAEVIRHGEYKSAFEPLVLSEPSKPALEMYGAMEAALRDHFIQTTASGRQRPPEETRAWYGRGIFSASEALKAGLVNTLKYEPDFFAEFEERLKTTETVDYIDLLNAVPEKSEPAAKNGKAGIALIEAMGEISLADSGADDWVITPDYLSPEIRWAMEDENVRAVVMRISSPGGDATAADLIWNDLAELAAKKPLIVSMGDVAASGGYYMAAPAAHIVAQPSTLTGSIGVIGLVLNGSALQEKFGVNFHMVTQSERKNLLDAGKPMTEADRTVLLASLDETYALFLDRVSKGRKMDVEKVDALAGGRVYSGIEARRIGLVDSLGGMAEAFRIAKEKAGLDPKSRYPVLRYEEPEPSLSECLKNPRDMMECLRQFRQGAGVRTDLLPPFSAESRKILAAARRWQHLSHRPAVLWPGYLGTALH